MSRGKALLARHLQDILFCQPIQSDTHFLCLYYLYPYYPQMKREFLRENPSQTTWELEIVIPTILYTFVLGISSSPTSPFPYHWDVDSLNTYHTLRKCQVIVWCCWEALEEAKDGRCNMELVAGSGDLDKTRFWEALEGRLGLEGLLLTHVSQLIV